MVVQRCVEVHIPLLLPLSWIRKIKDRIKEGCCTIGVQIKQSAEIPNNALKKGYNRINKEP